MDIADKYIERWRSRRCALNPLENRCFGMGLTASLKSMEQMQKIGAGNSKLMNDLLKSKKRK